MSYYQGDYYMAGGLFGKLKKLGKRAIRGAGKLSKFVGKAAPVVTAVNPALGMAMTSVSQQVGRVSQMFATPASAPAGVPMEGSTPGAQVYQESTYGGQSDWASELLVYLIATGRL